MYNETKYEVYAQRSNSGFLLLAGLLTMLLGCIVAVGSYFSKNILIGGGTGVAIIAFGVLFIGMGFLFPNLVAWNKKING